MKRLYIFFIISLLSQLVSAKEDYVQTNHRWEFGFNIGTNLLQGDVMASPRVQSDNNRTRVRFEVTNFFNSHFGLFASMSFGTMATHNRLYPFFNGEDNRHVNLSTSDNAFQIGGAAKFKLGAFEFHPMLSIGESYRLGSDKRLYYSNGINTDVIQYDIHYGSRWAPFLAPELRIGLCFASHFMLYVDAEYEWRFTGHPHGDITVRDGYVGDLLVPVIKVPTRSPLLLSFGISIYFDRK